MCSRGRLIEAANTSEAHGMQYSIHLGATKMYHYMREIYWCSGIKRYVAEFVAKCSTFQQVKIEHQKPSGSMQEFTIPTWKWEEVNMDFVTVCLELVINKIQSGLL